jgi:hypothetical protein
MTTNNMIEVVADKPYKLIYPINRSSFKINGIETEIVMVADKLTNKVFWVGQNSPEWGLVDVFPSGGHYSIDLKKEVEDAIYDMKMMIRRELKLNENPMQEIIPPPIRILSEPEPKPEQDRTITEQPERVSRLQYVPVPNAHIDKTLLTKQELLDVLAWAIENATGETFPGEALQQLATLRVNGIPDSAAEKLAAFLATITYGENNYIGPAKTGLQEGTLEEIVTTVPATSEADARARAHDIALTVDSSAIHDDILPPLAQAAQVARPLFVTPSQRIANLRSRYASTNADQLAKSGTIEQNPGPIYEIGSNETIDVTKKIISNPVEATSYLNDQGINWRVDDMAYSTGTGTFALRGGLDNQTDYILLEDYYSQYCSDNFGNAIGAQAVFNGRFYRYAINNKHIKESLVDAPLGTGIKAALNDIKTFTDMQRTQTNTVNGDALIALYERAPKTDYGCYLPIAKALAYEMGRGALSGQANMRFKHDYVLRSDPGQPVPVPTILFPCTIAANAAAPPPGTVINAYYMTPQSVARALTGQIPMPAGFGIDYRDVAFVVCSPTLSPDAQSYYTALHLEYPWVAGPDGNGQTVWATQGGAVPVVTGTTIRPRCYFGNLIDGPRDKVIFVCTTAPVGGFLLGAGNGVVQAVQEWTGVGAVPPPTNILPTLYTYWVNGWINGNGQFSQNYPEVLQYLFLAADLGDWTAAFTLATAIMGDYDFPNLGYNTTAANSVTILADAANAQPVVDGTIPIRNTATLNAGNVTALSVVWDALPAVNCIGIPSLDVPQNAAPAAGNANPRDTLMVQCLVQDAPWMTKFAIIAGMFKKSVLSGQMLETFTKIRLKNVYFAHRHLSQVMIQGVHNFWQSKGITRRMAYSPAAAVIDRRTQLWTKLFSLQVEHFKKTAGWIFMRPQMPQIYPEPIVPGALNGYASATAWLDAPMYFFNHVKFVNDAKTFYPKPEVNLVLQACGKVDYEPGGSAIQSVFGVNTGGNNSIRMRWENNTDGATDQDKRWKTEPKCTYALSKTVSLLNPAPVTTLINIWCIDKHGQVPIHYRPVLCSSNTPYLRWTSATAPSDQFRNSARGWMVITLPFYPPEYNLLTGQQLLLGSDGQAFPNNLRLSYNLLGYGSANFGLIQTAAGGDSALAVTESPF